MQAWEVLFSAAFTAVRLNECVRASQNLPRLLFSPVRSCLASPLFPLSSGLAVKAEKDDRRGGKKQTVPPLSAAASQSGLIKCEPDGNLIPAACDSRQAKARRDV